MVVIILALIVALVVITSFLASYFFMKKRLRITKKKAVAIGLALSLAAGSGVAILPYWERRLGNPDTEQLFVNAFDMNRMAWFEVGNSPLLHDTTSDYIKTSTVNAEEGDFDFANSGVGSGTIISVTMKIWAKYTEIPDFFHIAKVGMYIWNGLSWTDAGDITLTLSETWYQIDISSIIDTWAKVDSCRLYVKATMATNAWLWIYKAKIVIEYGTEPENPQYSDVGSNSTMAGRPCKFWTKWSDNGNMHGYIFGSNISETWENDTWVAWSPVGSPKWSNITKTLNDLIGKPTGWCIWANDTEGNWNNTGIQELTTDYGLYYYRGIVPTHDQPGSEYGSPDVGSLMLDHPVDETSYCTIWVQHYYDEANGDESVHLDNLTMFTWFNYTAEFMKLRLGYEKSGTYSADMDDFVTVPSSAKTVEDWRFMWKQFIINDDLTNLWNFTVKLVSSEGYQYPNMSLNVHMRGFIILNLPQNSTLETLDADNDGLNDKVEIYDYHTNPLLEDTDRDGWDDKLEVDYNYDPLDWGNHSTDTTDPTYSNYGANTTTAQMPCKFYGNLSDAHLVDGCIFGTNNTGTWVNDTYSSWKELPEWAWSNVTKTLTGSVGATVQWQFWGKDYAGNWGTTGIQNLTVTSSDLPIHSNEGTNSTMSHANIRFHAYWSCDTDLNYTEFSWNYTGSLLLNGTFYYAASTKEGWSNFTRYVNLPINTTINWKMQCWAVNENSATFYKNMTLNGTYLSVGWNAFVVSLVDVDKTLGQINASLNLDGINWTVIIIDYQNGTMWELIWHQEEDEYYGWSDKIVNSSSDLLAIYCVETGEWDHEYP